MPGDFRRDRGDYTRMLFILHARLRAHWAPGIPCALCFSEAQMYQQNSRASRRGNAEVCLTSSLRKQGPTGLSCCAKVIEQRLSNDRHGVWVPAFAGTTPMPLRGALAPKHSQKWAEGGRTSQSSPLPTGPPNPAHEKPGHPEPDFRILPAGRYGGIDVRPPRG